MSTARGECNPGKSHREGISAGGFGGGWEGCRRGLERGGRQPEA